MLVWFFGRAPERRDVLLVLAVMLASGAAVALGGGSGWLALLAADVGGGVVANTTRATAGWYAARPAWLHVAFVGLHAGHAGLAAWLGGGSPAWVAALMSLTCAGVLAVRCGPRALAPGVGLATVAVGAFLLPALPAAPGFGALFLLKLVFGFGVHARRGA